MQIQPPNRNPFWKLLAGLVFLTVIGFFVFPLLRQSNQKITRLAVQSFAGKVELSSNNSSWRQAKRSADSLDPKAWLQTGPDAEVDLKLNETAYFRVKENSKIRLVAAANGTEARIHLEKGRMVVSNQKEKFQVSIHETVSGTPGNFLANRDTKYIHVDKTAIFMVSASPEHKRASVSSIRGHLKVTAGVPEKSFTVEDLQTLESKNTSLKTSKIEQQDWRDTQEGYELIPKSAAAEAAQLDLSKKAGNFFDYIFDHGTFYQEKWGWCQREFIEPEDKSGVYLETTYDVFPTGAWVGVYLKTRDFDASKFKGFKIEARKISNRPHPEHVKIEFKAKSQVLQAYAIKKLHAEWETIEFPIRVSRSNMVSEVIFIFSNDKVGSQKSGGLQIRNFSLIPKSAEELAAQAEEKAKSKAPALEPSSKVSVDVGTNSSAITAENALKGFAEESAPNPEALKTPEPSPSPKELESDDLSNF